MRPIIFRSIIEKTTTTLLVIFGLSLAYYGQGETKNNDSSSDRSLKSSVRVNPSTLAMEFSLPLGKYDGRAGNSVPVILNYSSKMWDLKSIGSWSMSQSPINSNRIYYTDTRPVYSERSSAGWSSSLVPPRLEVKQEFYEETGKPWSFDNALAFHSSVYQSIQGNNNSLLPPGCYETDRTTVCATYGNQQICWVTIYAYCYHGTGYTTFDLPDTPSFPSGGNDTTHQIKYVKRVRVHMPNGSSQEFRQDDTLIEYCTTAPNDTFCQGQINPYQTAGIYLSVDGSKMKLVVGNEGEPSTLYLPNGSRYIFNSNLVGEDRYASQFIDVNGNTILFGQSVVQDPIIEGGKLQGTVTDTLGRPAFIDPLAQNKDVRLKEGNHIYQLPGIGGTSTQDFNFKWEKLGNVIEDPVNQKLSYIGQNVCFIGGQNTLATHNDGLDDPNTPDDDDGPILFDAGFRTRVCSSIGGQNNRLFNPVVLSEITLPNNTSYEFKYNQFGEITEIKYPSGGYEKFEYGKLVPIGRESSQVFDQVNRGVKKHWIYNSDGSLEGVTNYEESINNGQYPIPANAPYKLTITNRDGSKSIRFLNRSGDVNFGFVDPRSGIPYEEQLLDKNGEIRQRTLTESIYTGPLNGGHSDAKRDGRPSKQISVIIEDGQALTKMSEVIYENPDDPNSNAPSDPKYFSRLNVRQQKLYGYKAVDFNTAKYGTFDQINALFANSTPDRIIETDYLSSVEIEAYESRGIIGLQKMTKLIDPQTNLPFAKTEFKYDEQDQYYSMLNVGTTTGYSAPSGNNSHLRGNITTTKNWVKETDTWLEGHAQYDNFGNLRKSWDVGGEQSKFIEKQYDPAYKYAFNTKIISPAPDPTGIRGTNETVEVSSVYDFTTGLVTAVIDDFGQVTETQYDSLMRPKKVIPPPGGSTTETIYNDDPNNPFVKIRKQLSENDWVETTNYLDGLGRVVKTQTKDSQGDTFIKIEYDEMGRIKRQSNPYREGETILWSHPRFDELGRTVETFTAAPDGEAGQSIGITDYGISTVAGYLGTVITTTDAAGKKSRAISNSLGQLIRVDEPNSEGGLEPLPQSTPSPTPTPGGGGGPTTCSIPENCPVSLTGSTYPMHSTFYKYNHFGKMVEVTQGQQKRYFLYDSQGRLIRVRQPEQDINSNLELLDPITGNKDWTAAYSYDVFGNIKTTTDSNGAKTIYDYDRVGRLITRCYVPSGIQVNVSNCGNLQASQLDPNTPKVDYYYDGKGLDGDPNILLKGRLTKMTSQVSETRYTNYDTFGRLKASEQEIEGKVYASSYEYDLAGNLIQQRYPSGRTVRNSYRTDGRLNSVQSRAVSTLPFSTYASSFSFTSSGNLSKMKYGNGLWETSKFNERHQPIELGLGVNANDTSLWKVNFEYGELESNGLINEDQNTGTIVKQTISFAGLTDPFVQTYKYDSLSRITEAREKSGSQTNWIQQFSYDRYGNRIGFNQEIGSIVNTQLPSVDDTRNRYNGNQGFKYDKNGNVTEDVINTQPRKFIFNGDNKQIQIKDDNDVLIGEYKYDGEGKRVKKITQTEITVFIYDGFGKLVAEYSTQNPTASPSTTYLTNDHLNTPRVITDKTGNVKARRDFMPFGEEIAVNVGGRTGNEGHKYNSSADNIRQKFTGYLRDNESSLDYAEARMYDSQRGRFTAVDPLLASGKSVNPQTFNRYAYTSNNPVIRVDNNGLDWWDVINKNTGERSIFWATDKPEGGEGITVEKWTKFVYKASDGSWYGLDPNSDQFTKGRYEDAYWGHGIYTDFNGAFNGVFEGGGAVGAVYDLFSIKDMAYLIAYMKTGNIDAALGMFLKITGTNALGGVMGKYVGKAGMALLEKFLASELGQALAAKAMPLVEAAMKCIACFVEGTPIHTNRGLVPIEKIKVGDKVLSYNEKTKKYEYKTVAHTFTAVKNNIVKIKIRGEKVLTTTAEHPFYVRKVHQARDSLSENDDEEGEWLVAGQLRVGQKVFRPDGKWTQITDITHSNETTFVYNFEVEDNHNYFVGKTGILSHNCDTGNIISGATKGLCKVGMCKDFVEASEKALIEKGVTGEVLEIKINGWISSYKTGTIIADNGEHQAIRIGNMVYDNLNPNGIPYEQWIKDFMSPQGIPIEANISTIRRF